MKRFAWFGFITSLSTGQVWAEAKLLPDRLPTPRVARLSMRTSRNSAPALPAVALTAATQTEKAAQSADVGSPSWRDHTHFELSVGYLLDASSLSGDVGLNANDPSATQNSALQSYRSARQFATGEALLATDGLLANGLSAYFLSRFRFGLQDGSYAALNDAYDARDNRTLLIRAGYGEYQADVAGKTVALRAGRQFSPGTMGFIANYDGAQVRAAGERFDATAFFGRRASLFPDDDPGLVGGATLSANIRTAFPLRAQVSYFMVDESDHASIVAKHTFEGRLSAELPARIRSYAAVQIVQKNEPDGLGLGQASLGARKPFGDKAWVSLDIIQLFPRALRYDAISASSADITESGQGIALGLDLPTKATRVQLRADVMVLPWLEWYGFARASKANETPQNHYQTDWVEAGSALGSPLLHKMHVYGQYKARFHSLRDAANASNGQFGDTSGSGIKAVHEISGELRYQWMKDVRAQLGGYYRIRTVQSPYVEIDNDGVLGALLAATYDVAQLARLRGEFEWSQPSSAFAPELSSLMTLRVMAEARF